MRHQIISEIRRLSEQSGGKAPGRQAFERATGIPASAWRGKYWARWSEALIEAGCTPNEMSQQTDFAILFEKFANAARHYGKIPTEPEIKMYRQIDGDFPLSAMRTGFRSKSEMLEGFREWLAAHGGYDDVLAMLPATATEAVGSQNVADGFVYLIRSGGFYKIGRSDNLERRIKEIRIALPEAAILDHAIKTDDPAGIEAYWHRRFSENRVNGEWFKLSPSDVAAFKRRKFQ